MALTVDVLSIANMMFFTSDLTMNLKFQMKTQNGWMNWGFSGQRMSMRVGYHISMGRVK